MLPTVMHSITAKLPSASSSKPLCKETSICLSITTDSHVTACSGCSYLDSMVSLFVHIAVNSIASLVVQSAVPSRSVKTVECSFLDSIVSLVLESAVPSRCVNTVECL